MSASQTDVASKTTAPGNDSTNTIRIKTDDGVVNQLPSSNLIKTTKYTWYTWIPKSLWEQFRRIANVYFLVISVLMLIGQYASYIFQTPLDPYSTLATLIFVLMVTSIKEGMEDLQRARSDRYENFSKVTVVKFDGNGNVVETIVESQSIKTGDIIKLVGRTAVPADVLILQTSLYTDGNQCYVETSNIDGETNLKLRLAPSAAKTFSISNTPQLNLFKGQLEYEKPNKNIHDFIGTLKLDEFYEPIPLSADNIILRGSIFHNTDWAYVVAVYTGQESKIQMNSKLAPSKMSMLEKYVNFAIIIIFLAQITLVSIVIISLYGMGFNNFKKLPYIYPNNEGSSSVLPLWIIYFLLFNNFIPISLYVTLELVNLGQAYLIGVDSELYDEDLDTPCIVRSSNMVQELGVVSNIFSDKTGTLTRNEMKFVKFFVKDRSYDVAEAIITDRGSVFLSPVLESLKDDPSDENPLYRFLHCLTTCHTVVREKDGTYRSESPDELALVEGVGKFDCRLVERGTTTMTVEMLGDKITLQVLAVNAFNSDRKRMSVLVVDPTTRQYMVLLKGADSAVLDLCKLSNQDRVDIDRELLSFACLGLRTLCVARKVIDADRAGEWLKSWKDAGSAIRDRSDRLDEVAAELEVDMDLLGITAIEDRLQEDVPEVIADLTKAGIVIWMLTGDKEETAINIGHSCNLLQQDTATFALTKVQTAEEFNTKLKDIHTAIMSRRFSDPNMISSRTNALNEMSFIMDGPSFKHFVETDLDQRKWLLAIGQKCRSVIGCRLTPIQKQQLVGIVKKDTVPRAITLSIGDGANDVSMIREADVGVGIIGKEGRQAANNADFAVGQFRFLRRLCLVHGRWNYMRQCRVFLYSMHKNMVITLTLFWFSYLDALSGTSPYNSWIYSAFNFTLGLPIIFYGILNQDISAEFALANPEVYSTGRNMTILNTPAVAMWIWNAILYTLIICLIYYVAIIPTFADYELYSMANITGTYMDFDAYGIADWLYKQGFFWFFGFFSVPFFCMLIDVVGHALQVALYPSNEILFRERELKEKISGNKVVKNGNEAEADTTTDQQQQQQQQQQHH
eukprot:gene2854-5613_t